MNIKIKTTFIAASIVLMLAAALGIIIIGRSSSDYNEKIEQAEIYLELRDYDNAIAIYNKIINENRECAEAYAGLSEAYFAKDRADKALEILEKGAENTDDDQIIIDKRNELFPDLMYAFESDDEDTYDDYDDYDNSELNEEVTYIEITSESEPEVTSVSQESETETETSVSTTAATTVPTTAAPVVLTTAPPVITDPPATTQATTQATTTITVTVTTVTTTEKLKDVYVPDFTLMSLDEAYAWCSKNNIILNVVGSESNSAEILSQSPAPDSTVKENSSVIVVLAE